MGKDPLKVALRQMSELRLEGMSEQSIDRVRKLVQKQTGPVVAKAAQLAAEWNAVELAQDFQKAFYRFRENGLASDPQCWGKTAIIKALYDLAWQDQKLFVDACQTVQLEPVYGGQADSATSVRTSAIQALVQLPVTDTLTVMNTVADMLADASPKVRAEAARACVYCQPLLVSPLLRLKIRLGDVEPRVMGVCFDSLLLIVPDNDTVALVLDFATPKAMPKKFAPSYDVLQSEAVASLASSSHPEAIRAVSKLYPKLSDRQLRRVLLTALGVSPTREAFNLLLELLKAAPQPEALWILESLRSRRRDEEDQQLIEKCLSERGDDVGSG